MKQIRMGMQWACGASTMEVVELVPHVKCRITETWIAEDTGETCKQTNNYEISTDENGNEFAHIGDYMLHSGAAINMQEDETTTNKEESTMTNTNITFTLNGATYEMTANGRFYCTPMSGKKARIGKLAYEAAYNQHMAALVANGGQEKPVEPETKAEPEVKPEPKKVYKKWKKLNAMMEKLGYYPCESAFDDVRYHTLDGQSKVVAWNTVEEGLEWAKANTPKTEKKPRTKKVQEGGFEYDDNGTKITLTAKQADFFKHLPDTDFWENGVDSIIWVDSLCDEIGGQFASKPMTVGAMISTICEKGLGSRVIDRRDGRKCTQFALTDLGKKIATALGL